MSDLPAGPPPYNPEAEPFWTGAAQGRLVLPVCDTCGHHIWYPRGWCPVCQGPSVTWTELSGRGTVYACTVVRKAMGPWAAVTPYVAAYVELDEGPRVLANVLADDPGSVRVGDQVEAVFVPVVRPDGEPVGDAPAQAILRFRPRAA